jgi:hypothetical protein
MIVPEARRMVTLDLSLATPPRRATPLIAAD